MKLQVSVNRVNPDTLTTEQIAAFSVDEDNVEDFQFQRFPDIGALGTLQDALTLAVKQAYKQFGEEVKREGQIRKEEEDSRRQWERDMAKVDPDVLPQELNTPEKRNEWMEKRRTRRASEIG